MSSASSGRVASIAMVIACVGENTAAPATKLDRLSRQMRVSTHTYGQTHRGRWPSLGRRAVDTMGRYGKSLARKASLASRPQQETMPKEVAV